MQLNSVRIKLGNQGPLMTFYLYRVDNDQRWGNILQRLPAADQPVEAGKLLRYHELELSSSVDSVVARNCPVQA